MSHKCGLGAMLLWLWQRLVAVALIRPLVWEHPYAVGTGLKRRKKKKAEEEIEEIQSRKIQCGINHLKVEEPHRKECEWPCEALRGL